MKKTLLVFSLLAIPMFATDVKIPELKRGSLIEVKKNLSGNELFAMALVPELVKNAGSNGILFVYEGSRSSIHYVSYDGQTFASYDTSRAPEPRGTPKTGHVGSLQNRPCRA